MGLGGFLSAPFKAANKAVKKVGGAVNRSVGAAVTGHPVRAAKEAVGAGPSDKLKKKKMPGLKTMMG